MFGARLEIFGFNRVGRKILVPFHLDGLVRFCDDGVFPDCFSHIESIDGWLQDGLQRLYCRPSYFHVSAQKRADNDPEDENEPFRPEKLEDTEHFVEQIRGQKGRDVSVVI
jgi:hypothetical protein